MSDDDVAGALFVVTVGCCNCFANDVAFDWFSNKTLHLFLIFKGLKVPMLNIKFIFHMLNAYLKGLLDTDGHDRNQQGRHFW